MKLLLDANIVVAAEPYAGAMEANVEAATTLLRLAGEQGHLLCVASATRDDVLENPDATGVGSASSNWASSTSLKTCR